MPFNIPWTPANTVKPNTLNDYYQPLQAADVINAKNSALRNRLAVMELMNLEDYKREYTRLSNENQAQNQPPPSEGGGQPPNMLNTGQPNMVTGGGAGQPNVITPPTGTPSPPVGTSMPSPISPITGAGPSELPPTGARPPQAGRPLTYGALQARNDIQKQTLDRWGKIADIVTKFGKDKFKDLREKMMADPRLAGLGLDKINIDNITTGEEGKIQTITQDMGDGTILKGYKNPEKGEWEFFHTKKEDTEKSRTNEQNIRGALKEELGRDPTDREVLKETARLGLEKTTNVFNINQGLTGPRAAQINKTGEAALEGVPEGQKNIVKQMAEYKFPLPSSFALRSPYWQRILNLVAAYDPTFDASQYPVRMAVRKDFTSGDSSKKILGLNTAVGHINSLVKASRGLENSNWQTGNKAANILAKYFPVTDALVARQGKVTAVKTDFNAVKGEMASIFKQSGATDQEIKSWQETVDDPTTATPPSWKAFINSSIKLMGSRLDSLQNKYEVGIGKPKNMRFLSSKSRQILTDIGVDVEKLDPVGTTGGVTQPGEGKTWKMKNNVWVQE